MKDSWAYIDFKDVFPIKMGKTPPRGDKSSWDEKKETHNKWVSIADISNNEGKIIEDTKEYISDSATTKINKVAKGSLLMSFKLSIGRMAFAGDDLYTNEAIIAIPESDKYILRFMYYYLSSYNWLNLTEGNEKVKGATLNKTSIGKIQLPVIQLSEQQRIVEMLDASFAEIDQLKANAEKQLSEAKALFQKALSQAMTPKEGWEEKMLKEIGETQTGTTPSKTDKSNYGDYIPFIRPAEINYDGLGNINYDCEINLSEKGLSKGRLFKSGSIFMVCIGATIGKVGISDRDVSCNQQINIITPNKNDDAKFIYYAMTSNTFKEKVITEGVSAQATLPIISKGKWEKLTVFLPPLSDQQRIVEELDELSENVKEIETLNNKLTAECDAMKQALLRQVFE